MKVVAFFLLFCLSASTKTDVDVTCKLNLKDFSTVGNVYTCEVENSREIISKESAFFNSFSPLPTDEVKMFFAESKVFHYFPQNLEVLFPSLIAIRIGKSGMKEVNKEDLKAFPSLRVLSLPNNEIEVLDEGLFDNNPQLQYINFEGNKITYVGWTVFDNLEKLTDLWLENNRCVDSFAYNKAHVSMVVKAVKSQCPIGEYKIRYQMTRMEADMKNMKEELIGRISALEGLINKVIDMIRSSENI